MEQEIPLTKNLLELYKFDKRLTKVLDKYTKGKPIDYKKLHPLKAKFMNWQTLKIVDFAGKHPKTMKVIEKTPLIHLFWNPERKLNAYWKKNSKRWVSEAKRIYQKMNNVELLISIRLTNDAHQIVNVIDYFKAFQFNYKKILKSKDPQVLIDMYYHLLKEKEAIRGLAINEYWYEKVKNKHDVDKIAMFFLAQMSNEQIMQLASNSTQWQEKLFYYGLLEK